MAVDGIMAQTLQYRKHPLASPAKQRTLLETSYSDTANLPTFQEKIKEEGLYPLQPSNLEILQINLGYLCNQTCAHCHVDAGPERRELMDKETMLSCIKVCAKNGIKTLDITGGAPEMHPHFSWFIKEAKKAKIPEIIVRSNLTILVSHPKYEIFPEFLLEHNIRIISSLPCYTIEGTDKQRGQGVFQKSIQALQRLNQIGYGTKTDAPPLDLVYNPGGAFLPGSQLQLESDYKKKLKENYNIKFSHLFVLTNLPISRFLNYLLEEGKYEDYMQTLISSFNPKTIFSLMCRNTISVNYQGQLYDCDFNQMLDIPIDSKKPQHIDDFNLSQLEKRNINLNQHCYGCTSGAGSSCQGTLA